jgi:hypothetical protein
MSGNLQCGSSRRKAPAASSQEQELDNVGQSEENIRGRSVERQDVEVSIQETIVERDRR